MWSESRIGVWGHIIATPDQDMQSESNPEAKPSASRHAALRKRRAAMVGLRNQSRDEAIESRRRGERPPDTGFVSEVVDDEDEEENRLNDAEALRIWCAYIDGLGLPYSSQYSTLKAAFDMFGSESFARATDAVLQVLQVDQLAHIVDVMIEVSTSTWEQREEYIAMTLEILFELTAPTERDAVPLLVQTRLIWYVDNEMKQSVPPSEQMIVLIGDLVGNMCTHPVAYQLIICSDLLLNLCKYLVLVGINDSLLFALRGMVEPITEITPQQLEPLANNLVSIFDGLAARSMPQDFGEKQALEMLGFVMKFTPAFIKTVFTTELVAAVIGSLRGHSSEVHEMAVYMFASLSESESNYDLILASSEHFVDYLDHRLLSTTRLPVERRLLLVIVCNLMTATGRFSLAIGRHNIREVLVTSLASGTGLVRVEATFTWEYAIRLTERFEDLKKCIWPVKGFDAARYFVEAIQFQDSALREDTIETLIHIIRVCRRCAESGWKSTLRMLFDSTGIRDAVDIYFGNHPSPSQTKAEQLLGMFDNLLGDDDLEDYTEMGIPDGMDDSSRRDYEHATHWDWVAPTEHPQWIEQEYRTGEF